MYRNYFMYEAVSKYPQKGIYNPAEKYPEYPFGTEKISDDNDVYRMVRNLFIEMGMDEAHIGKQHWNPLKEYILPGDTVLLKPNLVAHSNPTESDEVKGIECLVTHPSVIRCVFDYVYIALAGRGKIILADAPVQNCDYDLLLEKGNYKELFDFVAGLQSEKLDIVIADLRDTALFSKNGIQRQKKLEHRMFQDVIVDLGKQSYFEDIINKRKLRVRNYDVGDTIYHHNNGRNEYCVSEAVLAADVVINLAKPKTHRIAGYTGALKNMIGINTKKEYLPHHRKGSVDRDGDEYINSRLLLKYLNSSGNDIKNWALKRNINWLTDLLNSFCRCLGKRLDSLEKNRKQFGMWYGNDTIWRTILDVNNIVLYCDKNGRIHDTPQRRMFHLGDMIVSGEKEGPLHPTYKKVGGIMFSDNPVAFDLCLTRLMGFDHVKFPTLCHAVNDGKLFQGDVEKIFLKSNVEEFDRNLFEIDRNFDFMPSSGWMEAI